MCAGVVLLAILVMATAISGTIQYAFPGDLKIFSCLQRREVNTFADRGHVNVKRTLKLIKGSYTRALKFASLIFAVTFLSGTYISRFLF